MNLYRPYNRLGNLGNGLIATALKRLPISSTAVLRFGRRPVEWMIRKTGSDVSRPFHSPEQFEWIRDFEANWQLIREECEEVMKRVDDLPRFQDVSPDQEGLTNDDLWKTYFLYLYGYKSENNCQRCPETTRILERHPAITTAFFSILAPGKHIPPHRGPFNGVLRYHLGLIVPEPRDKCHIRVDNEHSSWTEGGSMVFDDTFEHEVWNDTEGRRVVLFVDFMRPLPFPVALINKLFVRLIALSPFIDDTLDRLDANFDGPGADPLDR